MSTSTRAELASLARAHGFSHVGFAGVGPTPHGDALTAWLDAGHDGTMAWMRERVDVRLDPRVRMPEARTAMVLGVDHPHALPPDPGGLTGRVARYAWGRDYHNLVGKRLRKLTKRLRDDGVACWGSVDTGPVLERAWAAAAGVGFGGKNGVQIRPASSSWMVLAVVFVDVDVAPDTPLRDHCGRCTRCLDACPTDAFVGPRALDARRCIAYWTIEARGLPPVDLRRGFGRWVFGCDVCQEVCPHNAAPPPVDDDPFAPRHAWLDLPDLLATSDEALMERFLGTPLRRPKAHGLKRNALLVLANLGDPRAVPVAEAAMAHPHADVRAAAAWCLGTLGAPPAAHHADADPAVQREITRARTGA